MFDFHEGFWNFGVGSIVTTIEKWVWGYALHFSGLRDNFRVLKLSKNYEQYRARVNCNHVVMKYDRPTIGIRPVYCSSRIHSFIFGLGLPNVEIVNTWGLGFGFKV